MTRVGQQVKYDDEILELQPELVGITLTSDLYESRHEKTCFMPYVNNKVADQPVHARSPISAFVIPCLNSNYTCLTQCFETLVSFLN